MFDSQWALWAEVAVVVDADRVNGEDGAVLRLGRRGSRRQGGRGETASVPFDAGRRGGDDGEATGDGVVHFVLCCSTTTWRCPVRCRRGPRG